MKEKTYPITKEGFAQMEADREKVKHRKAIAKGIARLAVYGVVYATINIASGGIATVAFQPMSVADAGIKAFKVILKGASL